MPAFRDLTGQIFGQWTVLFLVKTEGPRLYGGARWWCRCTCGTEKLVSASNLISRKSSRCHRCRTHKLFHKMQSSTKEERQTPEYGIYCSMINRCTNPKNSGYKNYGGRGIQVCRRWMESFQAFLEDMGPRPSPQHTLERKENSQGYEPGNVIWLPRNKQALNQRSNVKITFQGKTQCLSEWAKELSIAPMTLYGRYAKGLRGQELLNQQLIKPSKRLITYAGKTQCLMDWSKELGINYGTLTGRLKTRWSVEEAFTGVVDHSHHLKRYKRI
jgi:hypothetical protein